jgi:hypothetical protein
MENIKDRLSLGTADFNKSISENMIYVDKTPFIKQLIDHKKTYYFLSRPRRFGKTLFISTLENFFKGKKELFKNTYIYNDLEMDGKWDKYPIINISMKSLSNKSPELLEKDILDLIEDIAKKTRLN